MIILVPADFIGFHSLAKSVANDIVLQAYITLYEKFYIQKLLGIVEGNAFIADLSGGVPVTAKFVDIFDPFEIEDGSNNRISRGMKHLLQSAIFYHYIFETQNLHSQAGVVKNQVETSIVLSPENAARFAERKWNEMIDSWENIQWFMKKDAATYPDFNGEQVRPKWSAVL